MFDQIYYGSALGKEIADQYHLLLRPENVLSW